MSKKTTTETSTAIAPVENAIVPVDSGVMAIAAEHTSVKLITDEEAMEFLGMGVNEAVQRAQDSIPAAGINLVRGSRDFARGSGTNRLGSYSNGWYSVIVAPNGTGTIERNEDGFSVFTFTSTAESDKYFNSNFINVEYGKSYTVFGEVMIDEMNRNDIAIVTIIGINEADSVTVNESAYYNREGITKDSIGIWIPFKFTYKISDVNTVRIFVRPCFRGIGKVSFRKIGVYEGDVENPIWSASPFDVEQVSDFVDKIYDISSLVTPIEGFTFDLAQLHVVNDIFAELRLRCRCDKKIERNTQFNACKLDGRINPVTFVPMCGNNWLHGWYNIGVRMPELVSFGSGFEANTDIQINTGLYILANKFTGV